MPGVAVIGIGNLIRSDDGVGVHVLRELDGRFPEPVELVEGTVFCADLFCFLEDRDAVIFIDAIDAGEEPGTIFRFSADEIRKDPNFRTMSVHDFGIYELISTARLMGQCPEQVWIVAVQVKDVEYGEELSEPVKAAVPRACEIVAGLVEAELSRQPGKAGDGGPD